MKPDQKKSEIKRLEGELIEAYNKFFIFLSFEQIRSFRNYFNIYENMIRKELKEGHNFYGRKGLQYRLDLNYTHFSVWNSESIEDFLIKRECSKAFFDYKRVFKAITLLQAYNPLRRSTFTQEFEAFQYELISV